MTDYVDQILTTSTNKKSITQLLNATTPLTGAEYVPIVQGGTVKKTPVNTLGTGLAEFDATFLLISSDPTLPNGRFLQAGTGISLTDNGAGNALIITANAAASGYQTVEEEGSSLTQRTVINFVGGGITAADDSGNSRTNVTLDATLNALAAFNTTGFLVQTAADTFAGRVLQAGTGITISNPAGTAGDPTISTTITQYTDEMAQDAVGGALTDSSTVDFTYNDGANTITASVIQGGIDHGSIGGLGDDDHTQYHNDSRALTWLGTRSTSDLPEGSNLYYTNERAQDAVGGALTDTTTIDFTYDDAGNSITADVKTNSISNSLFRQSAALSVVGRSANSTGNVADIAAANDGEILRRSGTSIGFGTIATAGIADDAVTFAKIQNISTSRILGRTTASSGDIEELTVGSNITLSGGSLSLGTKVVLDDSTHTLTNKTIDANGTGNSITNLETADFAANVIDTDATLAANSNSRLATQAAVKSYVDNLITGLQWKTAVRVATTANGTLASDFENGDTVDGVTLATGDRILIKNQSTGSQNGIYIVAASGAPSRSTDADTGAELINATVFVREGTTNADTQWTCTNDSITIGSTSIVFAQVSGAGTYAAGTGLTLTGNTFAIDSTVVTLSGSQTLTNKSIDAGQLTGTVVAGRLPALTGGDVTSSAGSAVMTIGNDTVTFAKFQNISTGVVLGRTTASSGDVEELSAGTGISISGGSISTTITQYTDEMAQDAVGAMVADTTTIDVTYTDATPELKWDVKTNSISDSLLRQSSGLSIIGRSANSTGNVADITGTDGQVLRVSGTALGFGTIATAGIADDAVTYAKMQNISATSRILGRKTASAGDTEECTLSEILDFIGSAAQGDILYRGASAWARLGAGTSGQFLKTNGTGANPAWADATGTGTVTSVAATAPSAGFTISGSPITTSGTLTFALADDLSAVEGLSTTGIAARTASNTWTTRTITGGGGITFTNGNGVSGNPTAGFSGLQTIWIPAAAIRPSSSGGCAALALVATSANHPDVSSLDFDSSTAEYAQFSIRFPKGWDEGTITAVFHWSHASTSTNFGVRWGLQGVALSDDDAIGTAYGTAQEVTDTGGTTNDLYISATTSAITIAGTPTVGDQVFFRVYRDPANAGDTMAIDARLMGVTLFYTRDTLDDT